MDDQQSLYKIDYRQWLLNLLLLDGVLSIITVVFPFILNSDFLNLSRETFAISLLGGLILVFAIRNHYGEKCIYCNHCGYWVQSFQEIILFLGLLYLSVLEFFLCSFSLEPNLIKVLDDFLLITTVIFVLLIPYMLAMIFVYYPGQRRLTRKERNITDSTSEWYLGE